MHDPKTKQKKITALKKAISSLNNVLQMVEDGRYCIDIMQQNLAVLGLLKSFHSQMMEAHLASCFAKGMESNNASQKKKMIQEVLKVNQLFNR